MHTKKLSLHQMVIDSGGWVESYNESLNSKFDSASWHKKGNTHVGTGVIDDETFEIYIEPGSYDFNNKVFSFANIAFAKIINGKPSEKLQFNSSNGSKILGAICNAVIAYIKDFDVDALVFVATDNIDKRMRIYNAVAMKKVVSYSFNSRLRDIDIGNGARMTILLNKKIEEYEAPFVEYLKSLPPK